MRRGRRRPTLAITNDPGSPLASAADEVLALYAGEESGGGHKTYTCQLAVVAMLSEALAGSPTPVRVWPAFPIRVAAALGLTKELESAVATLVEDDRCAVLARGFQHATAFEWALKLRTGSGAGSALLHGRLPPRTGGSGGAGISGAGHCNGR